MAKLVKVDPKNLGEYIKRRREEMGISKYSLALQLRVSPSTVTRWERGYTSTIRSDIVIKMANILGVSPDSIFQGGYADGEAALKAVSTLRERKEHRFSALLAGLTDEQLDVVLLEVGALVKDNTTRRNCEIKAERAREKAKDEQE